MERGTIPTSASGAMAVEDRTELAFDSVLNTLTQAAAREHLHESLPGESLGKKWIVSRDTTPRTAEYLESAGAQ